MEVAKTNTSFLATKAPDTCLCSVFFCYSCNIKPHLDCSCFFFSFYFTDLGRVDSGGWGSRIPRILRIFFVSMLLLFLVLFELIRRLGILSWRERRALSPGFVSTIYRSLGLDFVHNGVSRSTSLGDLLMSLLHVKTWL